MLFIMGRYAEAKEASARKNNVSCRSFKNKRGNVSFSPEAVGNKIFTRGYKRSQKITSGLHHIGLQILVATQVESLCCYSRYKQAFGVSQKIVHCMEAHLLSMPKTCALITRIGAKIQAVLYVSLPRTTG